MSICEFAGCERPATRRYEGPPSDAEVNWEEEQHGVRFNILKSYPVCDEHEANAIKDNFVKVEDL